MIPPSRIIRLARQIRARSFEVDFNVKRESPSQTYKLYQPPERPTLTAHRAVGIARRVGGRRRAKRDSYRPRLTHSSWVNINGGWYETRTFPDAIVPGAQHFAACIVCRNLEIGADHGGDIGHDAGVKANPSLIDLTSTPRPSSPPPPHPPDRPGHLAATHRSRPQHRLPADSGSFSPCPP